MDAKTNGAMPASGGAYDNVLIDSKGQLPPVTIEYRAPGLTKREEFAMAAMQGILANPYYAEQAVDGNCSGDPADTALYHADALLAALSQEPQG